MILEIPICRCGLEKKASGPNKDLFYCENCDRCQDIEREAVTFEKDDDGDPVPVWGDRNQTLQDVVFAMKLNAEWMIQEKKGKAHD